jgi:SAM-dependent methyltransferase
LDVEISLGLEIMELPMRGLAENDRESVYRDFTGKGDMVEIPCSREYYGNVLHVCRSTGLVRVRDVRSADQIASDWSNLVYGDEFSKTKYTARIPAVKARHIYVAEYLASFSNVSGKLVCDLGAGEGQFLEILSTAPYSANVFGIEPSENNCRLLRESGFDYYEGTAECYSESEDFVRNRFDVVTISWTLCNSSSPLSIVKIAKELLKPGGLLLIAESSRILVPFKKPLGMYFSPLPPDLHPFHFSSNSLKNLVNLCGLSIVGINRFIDSDYLCLVARKDSIECDPVFFKDNYEEVLDFFNRWDIESKFYVGE